MGNPAEGIHAQPLSHRGPRRRRAGRAAGSLVTRLRELVWTIAGCAAIGLLTLLYTRGVRVNSTTVALSLLLVVTVIAAFATRRVAIVTSVVAFGCFNFFFLPPL